MTISFDDPSSSETASPNPFADYELDVTFTNGSQSYTVPGYITADGDAAETIATAGDQWNVHLEIEGKTGSYIYETIGDNRQ